MRLATLDKQAVVVRGGSNRDPVALAAQVRKALERDGRPVLSVFIFDVGAAGSFNEAVRRACADGPVVHGKVQVSTVGQLVEAGFKIADERSADEAYCHYHVYFEDPVQELHAEKWIACFSEPIVNPARARGGPP